MTSKKYLMLQVLLLVISSSPSSHAQDIAAPEPGEEPVTITADMLTFDPDTNLYTAEGNVEIKQGRRSLYADRAVLNKVTKDARAEGTVTFIDEEDTVSCETLDINMESSKGTIKRGRLFMRKGNFHLTADEIEKTGDKDYSIKSGVFTTCDGDPPSWSFSAATANITFGEYLHSYNTAFRIRGVPALYIPYLIMPVKTERQSGLLIPRLSYSDNRGFEVDNSFYWAVSKNTDATFSLNYLSLKGLEEGAEYRYILSKNTKGIFNGTYLSEQGTDNSRWTLKYRHDQIFNPTFHNKTNINFVSDNLYYRTYGEAVEERSQDKLESYVSFTKNWGKFSLITQFKYFKDISGQDNTVLQRFPQMLLTGLRQPIGGSPLYFSLSSSAVNFYRDKGEKGERMDLNPRLSMTITPSGYFTFTPEFGLRETAYLIEGRKGWDSRDIYDIKGTLSTALIKTSSLEGDSLRKIRHTIEPEIVYEYVPEVNQDDLPQFDPMDRIAGKNMITYSLINRLAGKIYSSEEDSHVREFMLFKISQGYDINELRRETVSGTDERRPFTDIKGQLRVTPNQYMNMVSDAALNTYGNYLSAINMSLGINDGRGDMFSIDYRFAKDSLEYVRGKAIVNTSSSMNLSFDGRYSILEGHYLENIYAIDYHPQCWGIQLSYSERPEEKRFLAVVNLSGMGTVGKIKGVTQY